MEFITKHFVKREISFYIALAVALLSIIAGIIYGAGIKGYLTASYNVWVLLLPILAAIGFIGLELLGETKLGEALMGILNFIAFIASILSVYPYISSMVMTNPDVFTIPGMNLIIAFVVIVIINSISSNVLAWIRKPVAKENL